MKEVEMLKKEMERLKKEVGHYKVMISDLKREIERYEIMVELFEMDTEEIKENIGRWSGKEVRTLLDEEGAELLNRYIAYLEKGLSKEVGA